MQLNKYGGVCFYYYYYYFPYSLSFLLNPPASFCCSSIYFIHRAWVSIHSLFIDPSIWFLTLGFAHLHLIKKQDTQNHPLKMKVPISLKSTNTYWHLLIVGAMRGTQMKKTKPVSLQSSQSWYPAVWLVQGWCLINVDELSWHLMELTYVYK